MTIEQWSVVHPEWQHVVAMAEAAEQLRHLTAEFEWQIASFTFVALVNGDPAGYLRYCTQPIGPDNECPALMLDGVELVEGKVIGFYVLEEFRRMGFGRKLQQAAITHAKSLNLYQLRSRSAATKTANHQLKLSMGFSAVPTIRANGRQGVYFLMPLTHQENHQ